MTTGLREGEIWYQNQGCFQTTASDVYGGMGVDTEYDRNDLVPRKGSTAEMQDIN
jgi:hypothetical protein